MKNPIDWQPILLECKKDIQKNIKPCLKRLKEPQPELGMGAGGDAMKPVDLAAETAIVETFQRHGVSFTLISEESGIKKFGAKPEECYVTVDPIDGTTNLMHGLPFYASSIAVSQKPELNDVYAGMVVDLSHGVTYTAFKGEGAYRDGKKMETSKTTSLDAAVVGLDLNTYKAKEGVPKVTALIVNTRHIRHFGANALEVCYVANGSTDAFIDLRGKIRTTDVAAGFLIVKEAGGIVTTPDNQTLNVKLDPMQKLSFIASANIEIHNKIVSLVKH
ncbi:MAG: D-fructose 1,6-bisphosphatase [Candidatus Bathyarchaeota archaeon]|nr:D-fructose 1,6-bisphosphatase [Candidatus Bathyarchaeota archaeon]